MIASFCQYALAPEAEDVTLIVPTVSFVAVKFVKEAFVPVRFVTVSFVAVKFVKEAFEPVIDALLIVAFVAVRFVIVAFVAVAFVTVTFVKANVPNVVVPATDKLPPTETEPVAVIFPETATLDGMLAPIKTSPA